MTMKEFDNNQYEYQHGFSSIITSMFDSRARIYKAGKTMAVINEYLGSAGRKASELDVLDIGCSTGYMTKYYGQFFRSITGIDIDDKAVLHAKENNAGDNISFHKGDAMNIGFPSQSFDVVTCSHIYEHVPDANLMMKEIFRVLKDDGFCYFVAGNRFILIEGHYKLPLLSAIPKFLANHYIRLAGKGDFYYEKHLSFWGIKKLVKDFRVIDYTLQVIRDPAKFYAEDMIVPGSFKQRISLFILGSAYWISPTYIWILKK